MCLLWLAYRKRIYCHEETAIVINLVDDSRYCYLIERKRITAPLTYF